MPEPLKPSFIRGLAETFGASIDPPERPFRELPDPDQPLRFVGSWECELSDFLEEYDG